MGINWKEWACDSVKEFIDGHKSTFVDGQMVKKKKIIMWTNTGTNIYADIYL